MMPLEQLIEPITAWLLEVSEELEQHTSRICRKYHVPVYANEGTWNEETGYNQLYSFTI